MGSVTSVISVPLVSTLARELAKREEVRTRLRTTLARMMLFAWCPEGEALLRVFRASAEEGTSGWRGGKRGTGQAAARGGRKAQERPQAAPLPHILFLCCDELRLCELARCGPGGKRTAPFAALPCSCEASSRVARFGSADESLALSYLARLPAATKEALSYLLITIYGCSRGGPRCSGLVLDHPLTWSLLHSSSLRLSVCSRLSIRSPSHFRTFPHLQVQGLRRLR